MSNYFESPANENQLAFLRRLEESTGETVRRPLGRRDASREIEKLLALDFIQDEENAGVLAS